MQDNMNNEGMCDLLINECNNLVKDIFNGQYILFCSRISTISQQLLNLKTGIHNDLASKDKTIEELKRINDTLVEQVTGLPVDKSEEKGGAGNGTD